MALDGGTPQEIIVKEKGLLTVKLTAHGSRPWIGDNAVDHLIVDYSVIRKKPMFLGGTCAYLEKLCQLAPDAAIGFKHGASDARFFSEKGIHGVIWGADGDNSAHAADEHVNIDSIQKIYRVLTRFVESF